MDRQERIDKKRGRSRQSLDAPKQEDVQPGKIFSLTKSGVQGVLSKDPRFRGPENRKERRAWDKWWKLKGRGFTKPPKRGERHV